MPTRGDCISCRKRMGEVSKKNYLAYRDPEWNRARSNRCEEACNWCYWYAWDNASRVDTFGMLNCQHVKVQNN
jgi:hypothetical protein